MKLSQDEIATLMFALRDAQASYYRDSLLAIKYNDQRYVNELQRKTLACEALIDKLKLEI